MFAIDSFVSIAVQLRGNACDRLSMTHVYLFVNTCECFIRLLTVATGKKSFLHLIWQLNCCQCLNEIEMIFCVRFEFHFENAVTFRLRCRIAFGLGCWNVDDVKHQSHTRHSTIALTLCSSILCILIIYRATNKNGIIVRLFGIKINEYVIINASYV